jgi:hypothetical protein
LRLARVSLDLPAIASVAGWVFGLVVIGCALEHAAEALASHWTKSAAGDPSALTLPRPALETIAMRHQRTDGAAAIKSVSSEGEAVASKKRPSHSYRVAGGPQFGSSSRNAAWTPYGGSSATSDDRPRHEDRRQASEQKTYRTLCVRLCDGYYWPISFSVTNDRLERDSQLCERSCETKARLFVYRNPGGDIEDMWDLKGRHYRLLPTAFAYRTQYVASCKCKPHPWEEVSKVRHLTYALAAEQKIGHTKRNADITHLPARARELGNPAKAALDSYERWMLPNTNKNQSKPARSTHRDGREDRHLDVSAPKLLSGGREDHRGGERYPDWRMRAFQNGD